MGSETKIMSMKIVLHIKSEPYIQIKISFSIRKYHINEFNDVTAHNIHAVRSMAWHGIIQNIS